jgi:hypothetical protein
VPLTFEVFTGVFVIAPVPLAEIPVIDPDMLLVHV